MVESLLPMQDTWVRFLGWEDPLEKKMATHSSILAWRIPWTEELEEGSDGLGQQGGEWERGRWLVVHKSADNLKPPFGTKI